MRLSPLPELLSCKAWTHLAGSDAVDLLVGSATVLFRLWAFRAKARGLDGAWWCLGSDTIRFCFVLGSALALDTGILGGCQKQQCVT